MEGEQERVAAYRLTPHTQDQLEARTLSQLLCSMPALEAVAASLECNHPCEGTAVPASSALHGRTQLQVLLDFITQGPLLRLSPTSELGRSYTGRCVTLLAAICEDSSSCLPGCIGGSTAAPGCGLLLECSLLQGGDGAMTSTLDAVQWVLELACGPVRKAATALGPLPEAGLALLEAMVPASPLLGQLVLLTTTGCLHRSAELILSSFESPDPEPGSRSRQRRGAALEFQKCAMVCELMVSPTTVHVSQWWHVELPMYRPQQR